MHVVSVLISSPLPLPLKDTESATVGSTEKLTAKQAATLQLVYKLVQSECLFMSCSLSDLHHKGEAHIETRNQ